MKTIRLSFAGLLCGLLAFFGAVQCDGQRVDDEFTLCAPSVAEHLVNTRGDIVVGFNPIAQVEGD